MKPFLYAVLSMFLAVNVYAQGLDFSVRCARPRNVDLIKAALKEKVLASIDSSKYSEVSASVKLRLLNYSGDVALVTDDDVVSGVSLNSLDNPAGLAFSFSGAANFQRTCTFDYQVILSTRGTNVSNRAIVTSRTVSQITVLSDLDGKFKRILPTRGK